MYRYFIANVNKYRKPNIVLSFIADSFCVASSYLRTFHGFVSSLALSNQCTAHVPAFFVFPLCADIRKHIRTLQLN